MKPRPSNPVPLSSVLLEAIRQTGMREFVVMVRVPGRPVPQEALSLESFRAKYHQDLRAGHKIKLHATYHPEGPEVVATEEETEEPGTVRVRGKYLTSARPPGYCQATEVRRMAATLTIPEIAERLDIPSNTVRYHLRKGDIIALPGRMEEAAERRKKVRALARLHTVTEIADILSVTYGCVVAHLKILGIKAMQGKRGRPMGIKRGNNHT